MKIFFLKITLRAEWSHSLKEKRMILRSIMQKLSNKFNISISEIDNQDVHNLIDIGICGICSSNSHVDSTVEHVVSFIEDNTDAIIIKVDNEILY